MDQILGGKFQSITQRIFGYVASAFALLTIIPVLVFCLLFVRVYLSDDLSPYDILGLVLIAFLGIFIAFLGFIWLKSKVRQTILDLRRGLEEIVHLDPGEEAVLRQAGEEGRIAAGLNRLVAELRRDKWELGELNKDLDGKVRERTAAVGRLALVIESVAESVFMTGLDRAITYVNPAGCSLLGREKDEIIGRPSSDFFGGIPGSPGDPHAGVRDVGREGAWEGEILSRGKDGRIFPVSLSTFCLFGDRGEPLGRVWIARDITREKDFREQQLKAGKLEALSRLVAGIVHELNNPLTGIVGYCEIIMDAVKDEGLKGDLQKIYNEARRCDRIVRRLRAFGRCGSVKMEPLDINDLVREAVDLKLYRIRDRGIELEMDLAREIPVLRGAAAQLQQALIAVLDNSLQALSDRDEKRLTVTSSMSGNSVVVKVIDSGCGIPEDTVSRIFDPFFSTRDKGDGAGLGLSLACGAVREHGGTMEAESSPGQGTTLTITLPIEKPL